MPAAYHEGRYWVRVTGQAFGKSKNKGTPEFSLRVLVVGRVNVEKPDGDLISCPQNERTIYLYITDNTVEYVIRDLERIGFNKSSFRFLDTNAAGFHDFTGSEFEAFCDHEEYQGDVKERWRFAKPRGVSDVAPLEDVELRKLDALFGKQLSKLAKPTEKQEQPAKKREQLAPVGPAANAPPPGDDIPF